MLLRKLPVHAPDELAVVGNPGWVNAMSYSTAPQNDLHSYPTWRVLRERTDGLVTGLLATGRADRLLVHLDERDAERQRLVQRALDLARVDTAPGRDRER